MMELKEAPINHTSDKLNIVNIIESVQNVALMGQQLRIIGK